MRQVVGDLEPRRLGADEDVLRRTDGGNIDQRTHGDVHIRTVPHHGEEEGAARRAARVVEIFFAEHGDVIQTRVLVGQCRQGSAFLLTPLPIGERPWVLTSLPLFEGTILVVKTEVAPGKPPLDGTAERGASAPAVRVARALATARVVDSL